MVARPLQVLERFTCHRNSRSYVWSGYLESLSRCHHQGVCAISCHWSFLLAILLCQGRYHGSLPPFTYILCQGETDANEIAPVSPTFCSPGSGRLVFEVHGLYHVCIVSIAHRLEQGGAPLRVDFKRDLR